MNKIFTLLAGLILLTGLNIAAADVSQEIPVADVTVGSYYGSNLNG